MNTNMAQIPNLVHVLVTNVFDEQIYRPIAKNLLNLNNTFQVKPTKTTSLSNSSFTSSLLPLQISSILPLSEWT